MLAESTVPGTDIECLRHRLPFVVALECNQMCLAGAVEPLYHLEPVCHIIIGQPGRLAAGNRTCHSESHIVPVDVCLQRVVDECGLLIKLVNELAAKRVGAVLAAAVLGDYAVSKTRITAFGTCTCQKICSYVRCICCNAVEGIVYIGLELASAEFPKIVGRYHKGAVEKRTLVAERWHSRQSHTDIAAQSGLAPAGKEIRGRRRQVLSCVVGAESGDILK